VCCGKPPCCPLDHTQGWRGPDARAHSQSADKSRRHLKDEAACLGATITAELAGLLQLGEQHHSYHIEPGCGLNPHQRHAGLSVRKQRAPSVVSFLPERTEHETNHSGARQRRHRLLLE
jgi:hypothetical protein